MSWDITLKTFVGVEVDIMAYFETYTRPAEPPSCGHYQEVTTYCPTCGSRGVPEREDLRLSPAEPLPPIMLTLLKEALETYGGLGGRSPEDVLNANVTNPYHLGMYLNKLSNGLTFISEDGESDPEPRYYLGKMLFEEDVHTENLHFDVSFEDLLDLKLSVEHLAAVTGVKLLGREARLVTCTVVS